MYVYDKANSPLLLLALHTVRLKEQFPVEGKGLTTASRGCVIVLGAQ